VLWSGATVVEAFTVTTLRGGNTAAAAAARVSNLLSTVEAEDAEAGGVGVRTRSEETPTAPPLATASLQERTATSDKLTKKDSWS